MLKFLIRQVSKSALGYVLIWAVPTFGAPKIDPIKTIEQIKKSVLPIVCVDDDQNHQIRIVGVAGSGFFIDRLGRFITANHVLDEFPNIIKSRRPCVPAVYIPDHGWNKFEPSIRFQSFQFVNCIRDAAIDLAICEFVENPFTSGRILASQIMPIAFDTQERPDGTPVAFTGFPLEYVFPITSGGHIAAKRMAANNSGFDYVIDKEAWPGVSGSVVYLENGKAIGIILEGGINQGVGLGYARSAAIIVDFLSKHPANTEKPQQRTVKK